MRWRWLQMADPIHGLLQFDRKDPVHRILLESMNSLAFQRLRRVKQMGMAEFVFNQFKKGCKTLFVGLK